MERDGPALISDFAPPAMSDRLAQQVAFVLEADELKQVLRRNAVLDGSRRENDAEHSWHLTLMAMVLAEHAGSDVDLARVMAMLVIHDLVEIDAGDTFAYDEEGARDQAQREQAAADRLFALLPGDQAGAYRALWDEFEAFETPEARFAKAIDRLQPILLNFHVGGGTWKTPGVTGEHVLARNEVIAQAAPPLWDYAKQLVHEGARRGYFADEHE